MMAMDDRPLRRTAMHHSHLASGASLTDHDGWALPSTYSSADAELVMLREAGGLCDVSHQGKLGIQGVDALALVTSTLALPASLEVGTSQPCAMSSPEGRAVEDITALGLSYDEAMVLTPPAHVETVRGALNLRLDGGAHLTDETSTRAAIMAVGPGIRRILSRLVELDLDPSVFPDGACAQGKAAEVHVLVLRQDIGSLPAFQLFVTRDFGEYFWEALLHAGSGEGVSAVGLEAIGRLETGAA